MIQWLPWSLTGTGDQPAAAIHNRLFNKGYISSLRRGHNTLRIDPPLIIDKAHLDNFVRELETSLKDISCNEGI